MSPASTRTTPSDDRPPEDRPPEDRPPEDRPSAIAAATRALIVERGFEGLRTRDIADRVGINIATLHYHVPGKARLIELVAESLRDDFDAQQARHPRAGMAPPARLERELLDFRDAFTEDPERLVVMAELVQRARHDENVRAVLQPMLEGWLCHIQAILADGTADGSFRADADPRACAQMIVAALMGFRRLPDAGPASFDAIARELLRGLAPADRKI